MASYAAVTLLKPGTWLDNAWKLNPVGHVQLRAMGPLIGFPFLLLAAALLAAGVGWFRRRRWGWMLGTGIIGVNLAGDVIHLATGDWRSALGVVIAGLLLVYMTRPGTRDYFA